MERGKISTSKIEPGIILFVFCRDIDSRGYGISVWNHWVLVTPNLIPGETAYVKVEYKSGSRWITTLQNRVYDSLDRREPPCKYFGECGSCSIQHISDDRQWNLKINTLRETIARLAGLKIPINLIDDFSNNSFHYRNRAIIPIRLNNKSLIFGYYKANSHEIVEIDSCNVLDLRVSNLISCIKSDIERFLLLSKDNQVAIRNLRHISFRLSLTYENILITFVSNNNDTYILYKLANQIYSNYEIVAGITLNVQPNNTNKIFGDTNLTLLGDDYIDEIFFDLRFRIKSTTFFQINPSVAENVVSYIVEYFSNDTNCTHLIDAYCGVGAISLPLTNSGFKVIGIELNKESINLAKYNARTNNLDKVEFYNGNVSELLDCFLVESSGLILDPPRKGVDDLVVNTILNKLPKSIAYLSCNPSTLARDLSLLTKTNKYRIHKIIPFDFFPQTTHIECLTFLNRINF